jgi:hypothetical protein
MTTDDARTLVDRVAALRHPCDLDLLVFFSKHKRTLLASEQLSMLLGYDIKQMADSLEVLLDAGFVRRSQSSTRSARMYVFAGGGIDDDGPLPRLVALASTRVGRRALNKVLTCRSRDRPVGPAGRVRPSPDAVSRRPFVVGPAKAGGQAPAVREKRSGGDDA